MSSAILRMEAVSSVHVAFEYRGRLVPLAASVFVARKHLDACTYAARHSGAA
jgi:hypothetical protein